MAQSSAYAEYVSASLATSQAIWLRRILEDVGENQEEATLILCDNMFAISMTKNPVYHSCSKHIAIQHHFIREAVQDDEIQLKYCKTKNQVTDIFTKALPMNRFEYFREMLSVTRKH